MWATSRQCLGFAVFAVCAAIGKTADASGFAVLEQSASRLGSAFAGTAAIADDATTVFFNPAGMARLDRLEAAGVWSNLDVSSEYIDQGSIAASNPANPRPWFVFTNADSSKKSDIPAAYVVWPINGSLALGFGFDSPFQLDVMYDDSSWAGSYLAVKTTVETENFNPSISWRLNDRLTLGLGVNYQRIDTELINRVNLTPIVTVAAENLFARGQISQFQVEDLRTGFWDEFLQFEGRDSAWALNAGVLIEASESTRLGLAYRMGHEFTLGGNVRFFDDTFLFTGFFFPSPGYSAARNILNAAAAPGGPIATGPASLHLEMPDIATVSAHHQFTKRFVLLADIAWTGWSSVDTFRIVRSDTGAVVSDTPQQWDDVLRYALGAEFAWSDTLTFRLGAAFEESPVGDRVRTPRVPDADRTSAAVGVSWKLTRSIQLDAGYAHVFIEDAPMRQTADPQNVNLSGLLSGRQESDIDILSAQVIWRL